MSTKLWEGGGFQGPRHTFFEVGSYNMIAACVGTPELALI